MTFDAKYTDSSYIISADTRREIVLKDKKEPREYRGKNDKQNHVIAYRVDGGIVTNVEKCDFAIYLRDEKALFFIELKGGDYPKALS